MAVDVRTPLGTKIGNNATPNFDIASPASSGDRCVVQIVVLAEALPLTGPAGWTLVDSRIDGGLGRAIFIKTLVPADIGTTKTWNTDTNDAGTGPTSTKWSITWGFLTGVDPSFVARVATQPEGTTATTDHANPTLSCIDGSLSVSFYAARGDETAVTAPANYLNKVQAFSVSPVNTSAMAIRKYASATETAGGGDWIGTTATANAIVTNLIYDPPTAAVTDAAYRASAVNAPATSGQFASVTIPSTVVVGDQMYVAIGGFDTGFPPTVVPSGWTKIGATLTDGSLMAEVYRKVCAPGDANSSPQWTLPNGIRWVAAFWAGQNCVHSAIGTALKTDGATTSHATGTVAVPAGGLLVQFVFDRASSGSGMNTNWTPPAGITKRGQVFNSGTTGSSAAVGDSEDPLSAGTVGGGTWSSVTLPADGVSFSLTVAPEAPVVPNQQPVANAGTNQVVEPFGTFTLDGAASTDPDGDVLTYQWRLISKTSTAPNVTLSSATVAKPTFTSEGSLVQCVYTFGLIVTDPDDLDSEEDTVTVTVMPASMFTVKTDGSMLSPTKTQVVHGDLASTPPGRIPLNGITSTETTTSVTLSWTAPTAPLDDPITSYRVYRDGALIASPTARTQVVSGLAAGTQYGFQISAVNTGGEGTKSLVYNVSTDDVVSTGGFAFGPSGVVGGGFQNVMSISPFLNGSSQRPYLIGADVAGVHRSLDRGKTWTPISGVGAHVAAIQFSPTVAGKAYCLANEGFYVSTNYGGSWSSKAGATAADANGGYVPGGEHPRPTGNLIAVHDAGATDYVWVGCEGQGVKRSTNDGASYDFTATFGANHIRSVAIDPNDPSIVYVAVYNDGSPSTSGMYRSTNATAGSPTFSKLTGYPGAAGRPEEIYILDDSGTSRVYIAAFTDGVFEYTGGSWIDRSAGLDLAAKWQAIYAYMGSGGNAVVLAGNSNNVSGREMVQSNSGGASWAPIIGPATASLVKSGLLYGSNQTWLFAGMTYQTIGTGSHVVSNIDSDPDFRNVTVFAGRGGCHAGVLVGSVRTWYPAVRGLMVTVNNHVTSDPNKPERVLVANMDYVGFYSLDHGVTFSRGQVVGAPSTGDHVYFDRSVVGTNPSMAILGASKRGAPTDTGDVWTNPNLGTSTWTHEDSPVNADTTTVCGLKNTSGQTVLLIVQTAAPTQLRRKVAAGSWTQVTGGPFDGVSGYGKFATRQGSQTVFATDVGGTWRSDNAGSTWVKISTKGKGSYDSQDILVWDIVDPSIVYVADSGGSIWRITNALTATGTGNVVEAAFRASARMVGQDGEGNVYAFHGSGPAIHRSTNPRAGSPTWSADLTDAYFRAIGSNIRSFHVSADGYIYTAENGSGVMVGVPT